ncbi:holin [Hydrogenophaga sp. 2FB]|uniref:holin n=1 Tax=Hydrogenophaga sp. 2FB TaxID=2502187 RepID=UPI0010FA4498|nr:holin [Hydrogenophaga sp. 2FB]
MNLHLSAIKEAVEAATIYVSNKLTFLGGGTAAVFGFLHQNMVAICGFALGVLGFITNLYFQKRRDMREQRLRELAELEEDRREREHVRRMQKMMSRPAPLEEEPS